MRIKKDIIFVIKSVNYSEADKIITVVGRNHGKFTLFARGVRKIDSRNRGNIGTASISEITYTEGKNMGVLCESKLIFSPDYDSETIKEVSKVLFLLNKLLLEGTVEKDLFESIISLAKNQFSIEAVNRFRILFLKNAGIIADYNICSICQKKKTKMAAYNPVNFEFLCSDCYNEKDHRFRIIDHVSIQQDLDTFIKYSVLEQKQ